MIGATACEAYATYSGVKFDSRCSSSSNYPDWCRERPRGCWKEGNGKGRRNRRKRRVFYNSGEDNAAYSNGAPICCSASSPCTTTAEPTTTATTTTATSASAYMVHWGDHSDSSRPAACLDPAATEHDRTQLAVTCCDASGNGERDVGFQCSRAKTYSEAKAICEASTSQFNRLCSVEELAGGAGVGTGCMHNYRYLWSSNECDLSATTTTTSTGCEGMSSTCTPEQPRVGATNTATCERGSESMIG